LAVASSGTAIKAFLIADVRGYTTTAKGVST